MKITKTEQGLAVVIPDDVAEELGLREGDDMVLRRTPDGELRLSREEDWQQVLKRIKRIAKPLPPGYRFDREDANAR